MNEAEKKLREEAEKKLREQIALLNHELNKTITLRRREVQDNTALQIDRDAPSIEKINELWKEVDHMSDENIKKGMYGYDSWMAAMSQIVVHCQLLAEALNAESTRSLVLAINTTYLSKTIERLDVSKANVEKWSEEAKRTEAKKPKKAEDTYLKLTEVYNNLKDEAKKYKIEIPELERSNDDATPSPGLRS